MSQSELEVLMDQIEGRGYAVEVVPLTIGNKIIKVIQLKEFERYVEELIEKKGAGFKSLPYWAKVWDSSFVMAYFLGKQPVIPGRRMLEIGAGIGVVGIYAALCGHNVTITDINEDALLFARAGALLNNCPQVEVRKLDWNQPDLPHRYDVIVGSEVIYDRENYPVLVEFFRKALEPNGIIFLAKNAQLPTPKFFPELTRYFEFKEKTHSIRSEEEMQQITLYAIRAKQSGKRTS